MSPLTTLELTSQASSQTPSFQPPHPKHSQNPTQPHPLCAKAVVSCCRPPFEASAAGKGLLPVQQALFTNLCTFYLCIL
ncbi:hypothetical protein JZ751_022428 [Albula glossodonta]|uniref:Uncharacterized protein n=1 Tax=Albula glossodonta TaxID=121402 RepID=A0A8T2NQ78_9TELE|nr:hypothetical protein JZ751_022428 [Albula glossodonta]